MPQKKHKPEEIVAKLRQVDVLLSQGRSVGEAVRSIGVTQFTYYRWRKEFGGLKGDQVKRLKELEKENDRLRKAVSDLTLEKLILKEAALRHRGMIANHKRIKRLMREHDLQPRRRRHYAITTDSNHEQPIFPDRSKDIILDGPDQLWIADLTYVAIIGGFAYVAIILDAWSRRVVGYAIGRSIDARLALAALKAIERRRPRPGCIHHSDRGSQGGFNRSSQHPPYPILGRSHRTLLPKFSLRGLVLRV